MTEDSPFFSTSAPVHTSPKRERGICELDRGLPLHPRLRFLKLRFLELGSENDRGFAVLFDLGSRPH